MRPSIPASLNHRYFFLRLRDLIDPSLKGTQDIASEIRRQMSGGFDLSRIVEDLFSRVSSRQRHNQKKKFEAAATAVDEAAKMQSALQQDADELETLRKKREAASLDTRRLPSVKRAVGLAGRTIEHAGVVEKIRTLPDALANLTGGEVKEIERLQKRIDKLKEEASHLETKRDAARGAKRNSRLQDAIRQPTLSVWRQNAEELGRVDQELHSARIRRAACREELGAALALLGEGNVNEVALTIGEHGQLFEFLRAAEDHRAQQRAIEWKMRLLAPVQGSDANLRHVDNLRGAVAALRRWLRAPEPETLQDRLKERRAWILLAGAMTIAGAGLAVFVNPQFGLLLAAGIGIMVPVILLHRKNPALDLRSHQEETFAKLDIEPPESWDVGSVEHRLGDLEVEVASIDSRSQRARDRDVDRNNLSSDLKGLAEAEPLLAERRKKLLESLKLDVIPPDAELVDFARALDQLRATRIKHEGASGTVFDLQKVHAQLLSDLTDVLQRHGEPKPEDATTAKVYLGNLSERNNQLVNALDGESQADEQLKRNSVERVALLKSIRKIYAAAFLNDGDLPGLTELLKRLPQHRELKENANRLNAQIDLDQEELAKAGEPELVDCNSGMCQ